ncbi:ABC transporter permease [Hydrogenibacillus sp. N12]|uniref:ABC transporter permease n=1 Tax=Hydrogenibacillus sp. N12 TaxID=2866627 RepID=UPI001C7DAEAA|nr:ABC transporter permease [Hydrogenibacillus sp. N12]QZA32169.1 ABC transporter permease [Hydrogenibacillus sp. N12]
MSFGEAFRAAWQGVWAHKFRTFLTMLGVVIGVAAVIAVVAIGEGARHRIAATLEAADAQAVQIVPADFGEFSNPEGLFREHQLEQVRRLPGVRAVVTAALTTVTARYGSEEADLSVTGTTFAFPLTDPLEFQAGRFWSEADDRAARRLIVLDEIAVENLFPGEAPAAVVGQVVRLEGVPFRIVGVTRSRVPPGLVNLGPAAGDGLPGTGYVPLSTWRSLTGQPLAFSYFSVVPEAGQDRDAVARRVIGHLERMTGKRGAFRTFDLSQLAGAIGQVTGILTLVIGSIAGIALVVGGVGVMNIMLVSVTERTREIGLRMALGATRGNILLQFLIEAMLITGTGGVLGIGIGTGLAWGIAALAGWPPRVSVLTVVVAVLFSLFVGVVCGIYPARRAARLDPMEALRYE